MDNYTIITPEGSFECQREELEKYAIQFSPRYEHRGIHVVRPDGKSDHLTDNGYYILDEAGEVQPCYLLLEWGDWLEKNQMQCIVARTMVNQTIEVCTDFLAFDQDGIGRQMQKLLHPDIDIHFPVLFETMVFQYIPEGKSIEVLGGTEVIYRDVYDCEEFFQDRYYTKAEALEGHERVCALMRKHLENVKPLSTSE